MAFAGEGAADEGVEAREAMDEPVFHEKVERAVDCHRRYFSAAGVEFRKDIVSADWGMAGPYRF